MKPTAEPLKLQGPLDLPRMPKLLAKADAYSLAGTLDLGQVERVDSAGLSFLLELQRRARQAGKTLHVSNAPPQLLGLAQSFNIEGLIGLSADEAAGVKAAV